MADPKLGTLATSVSIDRGRAAHYGVDDAITGKIILAYLPYESIFKKSTVTADYFGPLKLEATLRGKVGIKIKRSRNTVISSDYGTRLFIQHFEVFNGSFKAEVGQKYEFPFTATFPTSIEDCPLPPSFGTYFSDYPDRVDAAVVYRAGAKITTPGIKVETSNLDFNPEPEVRYDLPRPPQSILGVPDGTLEQRAVVQNELLLPESERPSGVKQNLKAVFSSNSYPKFTANITCTSLNRVCPGLKPRFSLAVRRIDSETTASFFPSVGLITFGVSLLAHTTVDTSDRVIASSTCSDSHTAQKLLPSSAEIPFPVLLSKANDHSIEIEMGPFGGHTSSFAHPKISRKYSLEIKARLRIAETSVTFNKQFPIEMLPAPANINFGGGPAILMDTAGAGSTRISVDEETDLPPPAYNADETGDSATVRPDGIQGKSAPG